jgi:hypothetical protein
MGSEETDIAPVESDFRESQTTRRGLTSVPPKYERMPHHDVRCCKQPTSVALCMWVFMNLQFYVFIYFMVYDTVSISDHVSSNGGMVNE